MTLEDKISIVKDILRDRKVAIGFSGGADSTLIAYICFPEDLSKMPEKPAKALG